MQNITRNDVVSMFLSLIVVISIWNFGMHLALWVSVVSILTLGWFIATKRDNKWANKLARLF